MRRGTRRRMRHQGFKDFIKKISKRLDTTAANSYTMRKWRRRYQGFEDLIKHPRKNLDTTAANVYTRRRRRIQGLN